MKKTGYPGVSAVKSIIIFQNCLKNHINYLSEELFENVVEYSLNKFIY